MAARDKCEQYCNRYFALADAALIFDRFPIGSLPFDLTRPEIENIESVKYVDLDNNEQNVASSITFDSDLRQMYSGNAWPTDAQSVKVNVSMGFDCSASPCSIPKAVKQAILLYLADLYEHRTTLTHMQLYENKAAMMLLTPYRVNMGI